MSKIPFDQVNRLIDGSTGPYSTQTQKGRSANAGNEVANLFRRGVNLDNFDVKYAGIDTMHVAGGYDTQGIYHPPVELILGELNTYPKSTQILLLHTPQKF